jgi:glutathione S-transferase
VCVQLVEPWFKMLDGTRTRAEMGDGVKQMLAAVATLEGALAQCSKGRPFFGGDSVGNVDVALGGLLVWVRASEVLLGVKFLDAARTPLLAAWADRFASLDAAKAALPDFGRVIKHAMMRRGAAAAALATNN